MPFVIEINAGAYKTPATRVGNCNYTSSCLSCAKIYKHKKVAESVIERSSWLKRNNAKIREVKLELI